MAKKPAPTNEKNTIALTEAQKADLADGEAKIAAIKSRIVDQTEARLRAEAAERQLFDQLYATAAEQRTKLGNIALLSGIDITKPEHGWEFAGDKFVRSPRPESPVLV